LDIVPAVPASDFIGIASWLNLTPGAKSLSIKDLTGKVILLDCWTYTCIFCLRTIPIMKRLQKKYEKYGLRTILAHSAEYEFAKDFSNFRKAIQRYNITGIPVAFDSDNKTWDAYGNMYWPKHVLIDHNGFVRYEHAGYDDISEFEEAIIELLEESQIIKDKLTESIDIENPQDEIYETYGMHFEGIAPEICVGYSRLRRFGNNQVIKPDEINTVTLNDMPSLMENIVYLSGKWMWTREGVQACEDKEGRMGKSAIIMKYNCAKRVHAIIGTSDGQVAKLEVKLDGNYLTREQLGKDMISMDDGKSLATIEWPRMYNLVKTEKPEIHEVEIIPHTKNFVFYTFVFG